MTDRTSTQFRFYCSVAVIGAGCIITGIALVAARLISLPGLAAVSGFGVLLLVVGILQACRANDRKIRAELADICTEVGLLYHKLGKGDDKQEIFAPFAHLKQLRTAEKGLTWIAHDPTNTNPLILLRHQYIVSTGQAMIQIVHTLASSPCPTAWPELALTPRNLGHRIAAFLGVRGVRMENEAFNRAWSVKTHNEDFAALVLTPEMQAWLLDAPRWVRFHISKGLVTCLAVKASKPEQLREQIALHQSFVEHIPPELQAWIPTA